MEDINHTGEFEQFLRRSADEFVMVPSRRVWYSIYNDRHPDRKWPSLTVCLLMLAAILFIGISNNNSIGDAARRETAENLAEIDLTRGTYKTKTSADLIVAASRHRLPHLSVPFVADEPFPGADAAGSLNSPIDNPSALLVSMTDGERLNELSIAANVQVFPSVAQAVERNAAVLPGSNVNIAFGFRPDHTFLIDDNFEFAAVAGKHSSFPQQINFEPASSATHPDALESDNKKTAAETKRAEALQKQREWVEDYAFRNKPRDRSFAKNTTISYYITPSLGYRMLKGPGGRSYNPTGDARALNFEAGTALNYSLSDNIRIKSGMQFNYMNYSSNGFELSHPMQAELALTGGSQMMRSTEYSAKGPKGGLNHTTLQLSLPAGVDIKIAGRRKLKLYAGGTLQPGLTFGGNALVLSADENNFVSTPDLRRTLNVNVAAEVFVSYKTGAGIVLIAGPQVRYQLLSTFKSSYAYKENLYSSGLKIGITKNLAGE